MSQVKNKTYIGGAILCLLAAIYFFFNDGVILGVILLVAALVCLGKYGQAKKHQDLL